jgi:predicted dehydrogenase
VISALVVGCGAVGSDYDRLGTPGAAPRSHAGAYVASSRATLVGGVDLDPDARRRFSERWAVPCHASLADALEELSPELVSICTPAQARLSVVRELLQRPLRAIWIEKPLAESVSTAEAIVSSCERAGVPLQVNFLRRFDRLHQRVAKLVRGRVLRADFRFSGTLENYGSHAIDLFRWFVGEPVRVVAVSSGAGEPMLHVETGDGRAGTFARVLGTAAPFFDCDLWLDDTRLALTALGEQLVVARPAASELFPDLTRLELGVPDPELGLEHAMSSALDALVDHVEHGAPLLCTGADGLAELRVRAEVPA